MLHKSYNNDYDIHLEWNIIYRWYVLSFCDIKWNYIQLLDCCDQMLLYGFFAHNVC